MEDIIVASREERGLAAEAELERRIAALAWVERLAAGQRGRDARIQPVQVVPAIPLRPGPAVRRSAFVELRQLYADSRFALVPLANVAFQTGITSILEAMAMSRAVICSRVPGQTDIVMDGETGLYVPPGDPVALRAAIKHLLAHPEEAERLARYVVHERVDTQHVGKGYALQRLLERLWAQGLAYDGALFLDADSLVSPNLLRVMDARLARGERAIQAYYAVRDPGRAWSISLRSVALMLLHYLRPQGRMVLGGSAGLKGNGMVFVDDVLRRYRWPAALTEDLEYHMLLILGGERVAFASDAVVWAEMPGSLAAAQSQNARWERGRLEAVRAHVPRLLAAAARCRSFLLFDAAMEQTIPPFAILAAASLACLAAAAALGSPVGVGLGLAISLPGRRPTPWRAWRWPARRAGCTPRCCTRRPSSSGRSRSTRGCCSASNRRAGCAPPATTFDRLAQRASTWYHTPGSAGGCHDHRRACAQRAEECLRSRDRAGYRQPGAGIRRRCAG
jgi:hypothetical protein